MMREGFRAILKIKERSNMHSRHMPHFWSHKSYCLRELQLFFWKPKYCNL